MNHGKQPLSTLLWQAFYQHAQRETQINVLFIDSDPAVRLSLCGPVRLVVWPWLLAFFFCMSECVCLCLAVLWMDGNHAGMLYPGPKSLDMLLLGLARLAFWRTHTGLPPCLSLMWTWDEACCPLLWRKKNPAHPKQWALDGTVAHLDHLYGCLSQIWQQSQMSWMI